MTFLGYVNDNNSILIGMDTMVSTQIEGHANSAIAFMEKIYYISSANTIICGTGSLAILAEVVNYVKAIEKQSNFDIHETIRIHLSHITKFVIGKIPNLALEKFTLYKFDFENEKPRCTKFSKLMGLNTYEKHSFFLIKDQLMAKPGAPGEATSKVLNNSNGRYNESLELLLSRNSDNDTEKL